MPWFIVACHDMGGLDRPAPASPLDTGLGLASARPKTNQTGEPEYVGIPPVERALVIEHEDARARV